MVNILIIFISRETLYLECFSGKGGSQELNAHRIKLV